MTEEQRDDDILNSLRSEGIHVEISDHVDADADTLPHSEPPTSFPVDIAFDSGWQDESAPVVSNVRFDDLTDITETAIDLGEEPVPKSERLRLELERQLLINSSDEKTMVGLGIPQPPVPTPVPGTSPSPLPVIERRRVSAPPMRTTPTSNSPPPRRTPNNRNAQSWIVPPRPVIRSSSQPPERVPVSTGFLIGLVILAMLTTCVVTICLSIFVFKRPLQFSF